MDDDINMIELGYQHNEDVRLHHVLLPRVLPQEKSNRLFETELDLLNQMVKNVEDLVVSLSPKTVKLFQSMRKVHTERTPAVVSDEINALGPDDTFAMFVRFQHSVIMIHVPSDEKTNKIQNAIVATIPGNFHPDEVYTHESDMQVIFAYVYSMV